MLKMRSILVLLALVFIGLSASPGPYYIKKHVQPGYIILLRPQCRDLWDCADHCPFDFMEYKCSESGCHCQALPWQLSQAYPEYKDIFDAKSPIMQV
ncbi:unnamed protein product [Bursaphelenchus xylophilus]|uniref:(pine wood nematode) hypothetical protein n=1 Tax=Bursaphelenchus xylophilus TaxID=6326 RepID=A0A1I7SEJ5_BURXY|nr:unnamed protein product [Bursaphelenchus xylophilus]CAG9113565.1 unnamed protein product [Bursaphelenchus xylophilus]